MPPLSSDFCRPRRRVAGRDGGVSHHVSRARDGRVRDFEHLLRKHSFVRGFRETEETPGE